MIKNILLLAAVLTGCAHKSFTSGEALKNEMLAYTQKFEDTKQRVLVLSTYLNPAGSAVLEDRENENFLIAIYPQKLILDEKSFKIFTADNSVATVNEFKKLANDDPLIKSLAVDTPWADYYYLKMPKVDASEFKLSFTMATELKGETAHQLQAHLKFVKTPKSLYWNLK